MRPQIVLLAVAALAAALLALLVWRSAASDQVDPGADAARASAIEAVSISTEAIELEPASSEVERSAAAVEVASAPTSALAIAPEPLAAVLGRVIDARGTPIPDAHVELHAVGGPWATGLELPKRKVGVFELEAYEARTGPDGTFRLAVVVPTADWVSMSIEAGPFRGRAARDFGPAGGRNQPRIVAGENQLGDFALTDAGVVRGFVLGSDGSPIPKAQVRVEGGAAGDRVLNARLGENGAYEIANVPAGIWAILAKADGWLSAQVSGVEVAVLETVEGVDFALERAPTISGIVVDTNDQPIEGVRVWGWPTGSGQGAGGTSGADGRFTLFLPQNEPYDLEVTRQKFVENWGEERTDGEVYAPGTSDVRIVLTRKQVLRFRVVDAASVAPVTNYSLVLEDALPEGLVRTRFDRIPAAVEHVNGEFELAVSAGKQDVGVVAAGYAPHEARVGADASTPGIQTLRLVPTSVLRLHVVHANKPVEGATVLVRGTRRIPGSPSVEGPLPLSDLAKRERLLPTAASGVLEVGELAAAVYELTIDARGFARQVRSDVVVPQGSTNDLGRIEMVPESRILGRVIVSPGSSAIGLKVRVGRTRERMARISDPNGSFTIDGLEAGTHDVFLERAPPLVMTEKSRTIQLGTNETADLVFDLAAMAPCRTAITVRGGGRPLAGLYVSFKTSRHSFTTDDQLLTDEHGLARGNLPGGEAGTLYVGRSGRMPLHTREIPGGLPAGGSCVETIELALGEIVIELPAALIRPERGAVNLDLTGTNATGVSQSLVVPTIDHPGMFFQSAGEQWISSTIRVSEIPVGTFEARVTANRLDPLEEGRQSAWNTTEIFSGPPRSITVEAGRTTTVDLRTP